MTMGAMPPKSPVSAGGGSILQLTCFRWVGFKKASHASSTASVSSQRPVMHRWTAAIVATKALICWTFERI